VAFSKTVDGAIRNGGNVSKIGFTVNELPLSAGRYSLSIAIFDEKTNCQVLWYYNVAPFKVEGSSDYVVPVQLIGKWVSDLP
jgi:hypothetical protein